MPPCGAAIPVSLTAVRHGSPILSGSIFMIVSVRISVFDGRWQKMNSLNSRQGTTSDRCRGTTLAVGQGRGLWQSRRRLVALGPSDVRGARPRPSLPGKLSATRRYGRSGIDWATRDAELFRTPVAPRPARDRT